MALALRYILEHGSQVYWVFMKMLRATLLLLVFSAVLMQLSAQSIGGLVLDEQGEGIPFATVFIKQIATGTAADIDGRFFISVEPGTYDAVFSSVGYEDKVLPLYLDAEHIEFNVVLKSSDTQLDQIVVKAGKRDPAFAIIQKAIESKEKNQASIISSKGTYYIRALETLEGKSAAQLRAERKEAERSLAESFEQSSETEKEKEEKKKKEDEISGSSLVEIDLDLYYQSPDKYKEVRNGYKNYGNWRGLLIPNLADTQFDFYDNLVQLGDLAEAPIISPLSRTAIISYKYKLLKTVVENGKEIYTIKCIPRKKGASTLSGMVVIHEEDYRLLSLDFEIPRGNLKLLDKLSLQQNYAQDENGAFFLEKQVFNYETKKGSKQKFEGQTVIVCNDFVNDYEHPDDFFDLELSVTTQEALERDSLYWKQVRTDSLDREKQKLVYSMDSIQAVHNSDAYKDSIQADYNKVKFAEVAYLGVGFRNHYRKENFYISGLGAFPSADNVSGFRLGPYIAYSRRFENGMFFANSINFQTAIQQKDTNYFYDAYWQYAPKRQGELRFGFSRGFELINPTYAILNLINPANSFLNHGIRARHSIELINGLYVSTELALNNRQSLYDYDFPRFLEFLQDEENPVYDFQTYQATIGTLRMSYTPKQRYMTEPNRKVVLGSAFPTFSVMYRKGIEGLFSSDINFDYLEFGVEQDLTLGIFGTSKYNVALGKFVSEKDLRFIDVKRFVQSNPYLFVEPLVSYQLLDTTLVAKDWALEAHLIHHFNGALVNNIPLVKKTRIRAVAGLSGLWVKESDFKHIEAFAGIERAFRLGPRRRLRIGVYGILGDSNVPSQNTAWKFSLDVIDTWSRDWSF